MQIKENLIRNIVNLPGYKTRRKIVVFESDDWGSIRMPSMAAHQRLLDQGIRVDRSRYDSLDSLENQSDFTNLLEVLSAGKTSERLPVTFTLNTVMTNPDFEKIKESNFIRYYNEPFFSSYGRYYGQELKPLWMDGIANGVIKPQFHAREHLNVGLWMKDLRLGKPQTKIAFNEGFFGLKTKTSSLWQNHYLGAYWSENDQDLKAKAEVTREGLGLFESVFKFQSSSIIACNYIWPTEMEAGLKDYGVRYFQGQRVQTSPSQKTGECKSIYHTTGQHNQHGQTYLVRNSFFEPYADTNRDWVDTCLKEISSSFFWKTPAIISTHRINYAGNMNVGHRDKNLEMLKRLIQQILKKWPEVEFMSSDALGELIVR